MVRLALALGGLDHESREIDPNDREPVRLVSGQTRVPVLVEENGKVLHDTHRILRHLAEREGSELLPPGRRDQALTWILVDHADNLLAPLTKSLRRGTDPDGKPLGDDDFRVLEHRLNHELGVIEGMLERGPFLFGDRPTIADIGFHAYLNRLDGTRGLTIPDDLVRVAGWYRRVGSAAHPERVKRI
jgi:glutathione S-transferase